MKLQKAMRVMLQLPMTLLKTKPLLLTVSYG